mmetsp:Transcript_5364/g.6770  ORF Transcript_5364/g.6770 Transcript_5364/m.6770 type:complete len:348 (+) Transcript_5364:207-1250(+)|eukprot:CAMPEP_0204835350 /NCGR_PEP_ID=MMETSP1346-20131115/22359_1 /ASSEMBLY_ACC=CAM_ASM_000771 /TAXON_ID=215587 /ORGANISM="Aplanochytrium stocchinoi, Strain GSBS06" /LENGTH=347 /DNA_ID=CAMNT_0051969275 /DNA_START=115 /DNA_END=1158 /DNA_ORIENTATION=+
MFQVLAKSVFYFWSGLATFYLLRLFALPGAARRRVLLAHYVANYGKVPMNVSPKRLPDVKRLSPRVIRIMGLNPGSFTLQGTNTYLVGTGAQRILIDCGEGKPAYINLLQRVLKEEKATLAHVLITHHHTDHIAGLKDIRKLFPNALIWKLKKHTTEVDLCGKPYENLENGAIFSVDGASLRVLSTPGHASDHVAFFLQEEHSIFTGDCILGSGTAVFENLYQYMGSLRVLKRELEYEATCADETYKSRLYPGHGEVVDNGVEKISYYIHHRLQRENEVLDMLKKSTTGVISLSELVDEIYKDQNLNWIVKKGAARAISQHLDKLEKEGKVKPSRTLSNGWVLCRSE